MFLVADSGEVVVVCVYMGIGDAVCCCREVSIYIACSLHNGGATYVYVVIEICFVFFCPIDGVDSTRTKNTIARCIDGLTFRRFLLKSMRCVRGGAFGMSFATFCVAAEPQPDMDN